MLCTSKCLPSREPCKIICYNCEKSAKLVIAVKVPGPSGALVEMQQIFTNRRPNSSPGRVPLVVNGFALGMCSVSSACNYRRPILFLLSVGYCLGHLKVTKLQTEGLQTPPRAAGLEVGSEAHGNRRENTTLGVRDQHVQVKSLKFSSKMLTPAQGLGGWKLKSA